MRENAAGLPKPHPPCHILAMMNALPETKPKTRIQIKNHKSILDGALEVFSRQGFGAATLDQIAEKAGMSKPNLLYYFKSKEAIYHALLARLLETWLEPLKKLDPQGEPLPQILAYVQRKLDMSREFPQESRLFAHEIIEGAPVILGNLSTELKVMVDEHAKIIQTWIDAGKIAPINPHHLFFSIWSLTQHYADFETQVSAVLGPERDAFAEAAEHLEQVFTRMLRV